MKKNKLQSSELCPCCSTFSYDQCCRPFHKNENLPRTAVELMRSRYAAFALQEVDYLLLTTHPTKANASLRSSLGKVMSTTRWTELRILRTSCGSQDDKVGKVLFEATYIESGQEFVMTEYSRFRKHAGRWYYVDDKG